MILDSLSSSGSKHFYLYSAEIQALCIYTSECYHSTIGDLVDGNPVLTATASLVLQRAKTAENPLLQYLYNPILNMFICK